MRQWARPQWSGIACWERNMSRRKWRRSIGSIFGGKLTVLQQTNMVWLNLKSMGTDEVGREEIGRRYGL